MSPKLDLCEKLIPPSITGSPKDSNQQNNKELMTRFSRINLKLKKDEKEENLNFKKMNKDELLNYSKDIQKRFENSQNNEFLKQVPISMKRSLISQENALRNSQRLLENDKTLIDRNLSKRLKKDTNDLIMNRTNNFRQKKEIKELYEDSKLHDEKFGIHSWIISLRRPKEFKGSRECYVYTGTDERPTWRKVIETNKDKEIILSPGSKKIGKKFERLFKSDYFQNKNNKKLLSEDDNLQVF